MNKLLVCDHPMYVIDRPLVDSIICKDKKDLTNQDIVDLARLLNRYTFNTLHSNDIRTDILRTLDKWGKTNEQLQLKSREIWQSGWRPGALASEEVGSGADVEAGAV